MRKTRCIRLVPHDPLIDKPVENRRVAFRFSVHQHLGSAQRAHFAKQNDVALYTRGNLVEQFLAPRANRCQREQRSGEYVAPIAAHQKVDPRLKKIWKPGSRVAWNPKNPGWPG